MAGETMAHPTARGRHDKMPRAERRGDPAGAIIDELTAPTRRMSDLEEKV